MMNRRNVTLLPRHHRHVARSIWIASNPRLPGPKHAGPGAAFLSTIRKKAKTQPVRQRREENSPPFQRWVTDYYYSAY